MVTLFYLDACIYVVYDKACLKNGHKKDMRYDEIDMCNYYKFSCGHDWKDMMWSLKEKRRRLLWLFNTLVVNFDPKNENNELCDLDETISRLIQH